MLSGVSLVLDGPTWDRGREEVWGSNNEGDEGCRGCKGGGGGVKIVAVGD